ncbi:hypothetical protein D3C81_1740220 [compost metagenome]
MLPADPRAVRKPAENVEILEGNTYSVHRRILEQQNKQYPRHEQQIEIPFLPNVVPQPAPIAAFGLDRPGRFGPGPDFQLHPLAPFPCHSSTCDNIVSLERVG